ncbi:MAG: hypothetical protein JNM93_02865 [Bacteriovoracaceae bacterium]|nr:hypothetical protein [Bacteriovoracaceae bacterium]
MLLIGAALSAWLTYAQVPDWSSRATLAHQNDLSDFSSRENIYQLPVMRWRTRITDGKKHALIYPISITPLLIPYEPIKYFFEAPRGTPLRRWLFEGMQDIAKMDQLDDLFKWLGLHSYPKTASENFSQIPELSPTYKNFRLGATIIEQNEAKGLTFSCAACHSGQLFGKTILGLTNRFPRSNEFFLYGKTGSPYVSPELFHLGLKATVAEKKMLEKSIDSMKWVKIKKPLALGLDTSLAQVGLSLALRADDEYATQIKQTKKKHPLETEPADSKPAVWWNLKYKTRWLSDGSIISGNPVFTNFLWNEIGRGTNLHELESWLQNHPKVVEELTTMLFATKAPQYWEILPIEKIDVERARRGEKHFQQSCQKCHGEYQKAWSSEGAERLSLSEYLSTTKVIYHAKTPVINVGTDPQRYQGMNYFYEGLNKLKISKMSGTVVVPQKGYVPPPLVGIWARWPYFHNNSIPNLCQLMTPPAERVTRYWSGEAINPETDFDEECNGYPLGDKAPESWKTKDHLYETKIKGLSNQGHYERIFTDANGQEKYTKTEKRELIEFLKTL